MGLDELRIVLCWNCYISVYGGILLLLLGVVLVVEVVIVGVDWCQFFFYYVLLQKCNVLGRVIMYVVCYEFDEKDVF